MYVHHTELVSTLCRDGANTPIVQVYRKAFKTHECSYLKPFYVLVILFQHFQYHPSSQNPSLDLLPEDI